MKRKKLAPDDLQDLMEFHQKFEEFASVGDLKKNCAEIVSFCLSMNVVLSFLNREISNDMELGDAIMKTTHMNFYKLCLSQKKLIRYIYQMEPRFAKMMETLEDDYSDD